MLSKVIKNLVEHKYGQPIRYPRDCDALSLHIFQVCKTRISGSTLKRLFGFVRNKGIEQPRLYTLDIISNYLGHKGWEELAAQLVQGSKINNFIAMDELSPNKLKKGELIQMGYEPSKEITLEYAGKNIFRVTASNDNKLCPSDTLKFTKAVSHYPLLINDVMRAGTNTGEYVAGRLSGITYIRKIRDKQ